MSVIIRASYETESELNTILALLDPVIKEWHKANEKKGKFERVYIKTKLQNNSSTGSLKMDIIESVNKLPDTEIRFLTQISTIIKNHNRRMKERANFGS